MIKTSYFSNPLIRDFYIHDRQKLVCIATYKPYSIEIQDYPALFPTKDILFEYKNAMQGLDLRKLRQKDPEEYARQKEFIEQRYIRKYTKEVLSRLNPEKVAKDLDGKILLCYEKSDAFCHRHIFADWMKKNGFEVEEIKNTNTRKQEENKQISLF